MPPMTMVASGRCTSAPFPGTRIRDDGDGRGDDVAHLFPGIRRFPRGGCNQNTNRIYRRVAHDRHDSHSHGKNSYDLRIRRSDDRGHHAHHEKSSDPHVGLCRGSRGQRPEQRSRDSRAEEIVRCVLRLPLMSEDQSVS